MSTIKKRTTKVTKEAEARKLIEGLSDEKKAVLRDMIGKIVLGEVKNYSSTRVYKGLIADMTKKEQSVVSYICHKAFALKAFENMEELDLTEE